MSKISRAHIKEYGGIVTKVSTSACNDYYGIKYFLDNGDTSKSINCFALIWMLGTIPYHILYRANTAESSLFSSDTSINTTETGNAVEAEPLLAKQARRGRRLSLNTVDDTSTFFYRAGICLKILATVNTIPIFLGGTLGLEQLIFDACGITYASVPIAIIFSIAGCISYHSTRVKPTPKNIALLPVRVCNLWIQNKAKALLLYTIATLAIIGYSAHNFFAMRHVVERAQQILQYHNLLLPQYHSYNIGFSLGIATTILSPSTAISSASKLFASFDHYSPKQEHNFTKTQLVKLAFVIFFMLTDVSAKLIFNYESGKEFLAEVFQWSFFNTKPLYFYNDSSIKVILQCLPLVMLSLPQAVSYLNYTAKYAIKQAIYGKPKTTAAPAFSA